MKPFHKNYIHYLMMNLWKDDIYGLIIIPTHLSPNEYKLYHAKTIPMNNEMLSSLKTISRHKSFYALSQVDLIDSKKQK